MFLSENNLCNGYAVTMCLNDSNFPVTRCPKVLALLQLVRSWDVTNCQFCLQAEPDRLTGPGWALHLDAMWKKTSRSREGYLKKKTRGAVLIMQKATWQLSFNFLCFLDCPHILIMHSLIFSWKDCGKNGSIVAIIGSIDTEEIEKLGINWMNIYQRRRNPVTLQTRMSRLPVFLVRFICFSTGWPVRDMIILISCLYWQQIELSVR